MTFHTPASSTRPRQRYTPHWSQSEFDAATKLSAQPTVCQGPPPQSSMQRLRQFLLKSVIIIALIGQILGAALLIILLLSCSSTSSGIIPMCPIGPHNLPSYTMRHRHRLLDQSETSTGTFGSIPSISTRSSTVEKEATLSLIAGEWQIEYTRYGTTENASQTTLSATTTE